MNDIIKLLNLEDENLSVDAISIEGLVKYITLSKPVTPHYCPHCNARMYSRGIRKRKVNHPILQDGYSIILLLMQRRWRCTNPLCAQEINEDFKFVDAHKRNTNLMNLLILEDFRDITCTAASIAKKFNISDTHAITIFDQYVDLPRLQLPEILCVDEVFLDMDPRSKYALMLIDFATGNTVDVLRSRRKEVTEPYFSAIPKEERFNVKYLIADMYAPYYAYVKTYFPNATPVVDSFHVVQWLCHMLNQYLGQLLKQYKARDEERQRELEAKTGRPQPLHRSKEVYLLQNHRWILLSNNARINYHAKSHFDRALHRQVDTYVYEELFFRLAPDLRELRDLKEEYIAFNCSVGQSAAEMKPRLDKIILRYAESGHPIFMDFATLLKKYSDPILHSFVIRPCFRNGEWTTSRLSNGLMESINRKPKDLKRAARGYRNFEHFRNRILFATRTAPPILAIPRPKEAFAVTTGKHRGPYHKG